MEEAGEFPRLVCNDAFRTRYFSAYRDKNPSMYVLTPYFVKSSLCYFYDCSLVICCRARNKAEFNKQ